MSATVSLQVQNPDGTSRAFVLTEHDTFLLGRMKDCHLCLPDDAQVSRHHFLLEACPPQASLRDLGSMNGTHINGKKCGGREKGETPEQGAKRQYPSIDLKHGDRITVGQSSIEVRIEAAPDVPGVRQVNAALPEGDLSGLSPEAMQQLIFGKPGDAAFQLKGYHIERELGRGGCGAVYLAKPQQSGAGKVAVKIMLSRAQADTRAVDQFKREMAVIAKLQHPHIVRFLDSGSDEGTFFFCRTRLRRLELRRHPLPPAHREIPLSLRSQARPHRHHPQRKPCPHPRPPAGPRQGNRHHHRQIPRPQSQRPLPGCRETASFAGKIRPVNHNLHLRNSETCQPATKKSPTRRLRSRNERNHRFRTSRFRHLLRRANSLTAVERIALNLESSSSYPSHEGIRND